MAQASLRNTWSILGWAAEMLETNWQTEGNASFQKSDPYVSMNSLVPSPPQLGTPGTGCGVMPWPSRIRNLLAQMHWRSGSCRRGSALHTTMRLGLQILPLA